MPGGHSRRANGADELRAVVARSYQAVFGRDPYETEQTFWFDQARATRYQFAELVQFHHRHELTG